MTVLWCSILIFVEISLKKTFYSVGMVLDIGLAGSKEIVS